MGTTPSRLLILGPAAGYIAAAVYAARFQPQSGNHHRPGARRLTDDHHQSGQLAGLMPKADGPG